MRELGAVARGGEEAADAGAGGADALGEVALRHQLQLDLAPAVQPVEHLRAALDALHVTFGRVGDALNHGEHSRRLRSAVLSLGAVGPEAALPVMEGKAILFKTLAGIDAFPLSVSERDPQRLARLIQCLAPTFGGIALEDIAAAKLVAEFRKSRTKKDEPARPEHATLEELFKKVEEGQAKELALVLKADVHGSAEALKVVTGLTNMRFEEMDAWSQAMIDGISNYAGLPEVEARCRAATAGIELTPFARFEPWFVGLTIAVLALQQNGYDVEHGVEKVIEKAAAGGGKKRCGLETLDEAQVFVVVFVVVRHGNVEDAFAAGRFAFLRQVANARTRPLVHRLSGDLCSVHQNGTSVRPDHRPGGTGS